MTQQDLYGPPPVRRASTPVPPLPTYGHPSAPVPPRVDRRPHPPADPYRHAPVDAGDREAAWDDDRWEHEAAPPYDRDDYAGAGQRT